MPDPQVFAGSGQDPADTITSLERNIREIQDLSAPRPSYEPGVQPEPMRPLVDAQGNFSAPAEAQDGFQVQGVIWSHDFKTALVNDKVYTVGDQLGSQKIVEICANGFFLQDEKTQQKRFVSLYAEGAGSSNPGPSAVQQS